MKQFKERILIMETLNDFEKRDEGKTRCRQLTPSPDIKKLIDDFLDSINCNATPSEKLFPVIVYLIAAAYNGHPDETIRNNLLLSISAWINDMTTADGIKDIISNHMIDKLPLLMYLIRTAQYPSIGSFK